MSDMFLFTFNWSNFFSNRTNFFTMIHDADSVSDKDNLEKKMLTNVNLILLLFKDQFVIGRLAKKSRNNKKDWIKKFLTSKEKEQLSIDGTFTASEICDLHSTVV